VSEAKVAVESHDHLVSTDVAVGWWKPCLSAWRPRVITLCDLYSRRDYVRIYRFPEASQGRISRREAIRSVFSRT